MELYLNRFCFQPPDKNIKGGVFGQLDINGETKGYTVEQPWSDNEPFKSCVPDGKYTLVPYTSGKYGDCFIMVNPGLGVYALKEDRLSESDRYKCLFTHKGNWPWNFEGCIGIGERLAADSAGQLMVVNTTRTCKSLMDELPRTEHDLLIYSSLGAI